MGPLLLESSTLGTQVSGRSRAPDVQAEVYLPEEWETLSEEQAASQEGVSSLCLGKLHLEIAGKAFTETLIAGTSEPAGVRGCEWTQERQARRSPGTRA